MLILIYGGKLMVTCPGCGHSNQDHFNFCEKCGTNLKESSFSENISSGNDTPKQQTSENNASSPAFAVSSETPKKKSGIRKIALAVAVVLAMYIILSNIILAFSPATRLMKGFYDFGKSTRFTSETHLTIDYKGSDEIKALMDNIGFTGTVSYDFDKLLAEASVKFLYNDKEVTGLKAGVNDKLVWIDPQELYEDKFYYEFEDDIADVLKELKILKDLFSKVSLDFNKSEYIKIMKKVLGKNLKNSFGKVTVTLDGEAISELLYEMVEYAKDDKKLMNSLRKEGIDFFKAAIKQGEKGNLDKLYNEEIFENGLEALEDRENFEETYAMMLDELQYQLSYSLYDIENAMPELEITFHFGLFNRLDKVSYNFTMDIADYYLDERYIIDCGATIKKGAKFSSFNAKKAVNLENVIDDPAELTNIGMGVASNLIESITENKELKKDIEKLEDKLGIDIEEITEYLEYGLPLYGW